MRSEVVTVGSVSVEVRSRTRRTAIIEAEIRQALIAAHPEILEFEHAQLAVIRPNLPMDIYGNVLPNLNDQQKRMMEEFSQAIVRVKDDHPVGGAYAAEALRFGQLFARIGLMTGTDFDVVAGEPLKAAQIVAAFEDWLDGTSEELWVSISTASARLDRPLTPVEQRPPQTLTEGEKADPLSDPPAGSGNGDSKSESTISPSSDADRAVKRKKTPTASTESSIH